MRRGKTWLEARGRTGKPKVLLGVALLLAPLALGSPPAAANEGARQPAEGHRITRPTVAAGNWHSCLLLASGAARCWGKNLFGQLGNGTTNPSSSPVPVTGLLTNAVALAAGGDHTCALLDDGRVQCWGLNNLGQLGTGSTDSLSTTPQLVFGVDDRVVALTGGGVHTCVLFIGGTASCWGANGGGQLGDGTDTTRTEPVPVQGLTNAVALAAGGSHTCALLVDGTVRCWGLNASGQLGDGKTTDRWVPTAVLGLASATGLAAGGDHTCALLSKGTARCWGRNFDGQLGNGTFNDMSLTPVDVSSLSSAVLLMGANVNTCAVVADGTARCWGNNNSGQLGGGPIPISSIPVPVAGGGRFAALSGGAYHTCGVLSMGRAMCWGENNNGQLGNGTNSDSKTPVIVKITSPALGHRSITAGYGHTCALRPGASASCWGLNGNAQLANSTGNKNVPAPVSSLGEAVALAGGSFHTCALLSNGTARCWGSNGAGQLGNGATNQDNAVPTPVGVVGFKNAVALAAGGSHTCALLVDGTVRCWGYNYHGQLGNVTASNWTAVPVQALGVTSAVAIAAGLHHTCAVLSNGTVRCWGYNGFNQLGNVTPSNSSATPVEPVGVNSAVAVTAGDYHTCALLSDGTLSCWGLNNYGQLGNGTPIVIVPVPAPVLGVEGVVSVTAGGYHTCALFHVGNATCWGYGEQGQLGNASNASSTTPVYVQLLQQAVALTAGGYHTCALRSDGTARCWGMGGFGQLGDGSNNSKNKPVPVLNFP